MLATSMDSDEMTDLSMISIIIIIVISVGISIRISISSSSSSSSSTSSSSYVHGLAGDDRPLRGGACGKAELYFVLRVSCVLTCFAGFLLKFLQNFTGSSTEFTGVHRSCHHNSARK